MLRNSSKSEDLVYAAVEVRDLGKLSLCIASNDSFVRCNK
jgi:hypothetical protein